MPEEAYSRKPTIQKMREIVHPHIAILSAVHPNRPLTRRERGSLTFLIENTHALLRVIDGIDDLLQQQIEKGSRGQALIELHRDHPEAPAAVWKAFIAGETSYLSSLREK